MNQPSKISGHIQSTTKVTSRRLQTHQLHLIHTHSHTTRHNYTRTTPTVTPIPQPNTPHPQAHHTHQSNTTPVIAIFATPSLTRYIRAQVISRYGPSIPYLRILITEWMLSEGEVFVLPGGEMTLKETLCWTLKALLFLRRAGDTCCNARVLLK